MTAMTESTSEMMANQLVEDLEERFLRMRTRFSGRSLKSDPEAFGDKYIVESGVSLAELKEQRASALNELRARIGRWMEIEDALQSVKDDPVE